MKHMCNCSTRSYHLLLSADPPLRLSSFFLFLSPSLTLSPPLSGPVYLCAHPAHSLLRPLPDITSLFAFFAFSPPSQFAHVFYQFVIRSSESRHKYVALFNALLLDSTRCVRDHFGCIRSFVYSLY